MIAGPRSRRAFTLLELIMVVAVLATIAGGVLATMEGVEGRATDDVTRHELGQLRDAIVAFKRDLGSLPNQGPFTPVVADQEDLGQLLVNPLPQSDPLSRWDPERRRGWRGPYLRGARVEGTPPSRVMDAFGRPFLLDLAAPDGPRILSHGVSLGDTNDDLWIVLP